MTRPAVGRSRQAANLRPWRKGQSGNPKGRPALPDIREALAEVLAEPVEGTISLYAVLTALRDRVTTLLETSLAPESGSSDSPTRYLRAPKFSVHDLALPEGAIDDRITRSLKRFAAEPPMPLGQLSAKQVHFRTALAALNTKRKKPN